MSDAEFPHEGAGEPTSETPVPAGGPTPPTGPGIPASQSGWTWQGAPGANFAGWAPTPPPQPPRRRHRGLAGGVVVVLLLAAIGLGVGVGHAVWTSSAPAVNRTSPTPSTGPNFGGSPFGSGQPFAGPSSNGNSSEGAGGPSDVAAIAAKVDPALVDINGNFSYQSDVGAGTGIVLTSDGEVITNNHVIDGATKLSATDVGNGKTYGVTVVGYDPSADIAVLQLQGASGLQTATMGDSSKVAKGQGVVAIGNAGGTGGTPTSAGGSITALDQSITAQDGLDGSSEQLSGLLETNAHIQPGDSGGSLVDTSGRVIGIDTAASTGFSFQASPTQGYAIPINEALSIAKQIEANKSSSEVHVGPTAFLGVLITGGQSTGGAGNPFGFGNGNSSPSGVTVYQAISGTGAQQIGLAQGDVITSFDGHPVSSNSDLSHIILGLRPGQNVPIAWVDTTGQSHTATVTLGSGPAQ